MTQNRGDIELCMNSLVLCGLNVDLPANCKKSFGSVAKMGSNCFLFYFVFK